MMRETECFSMNSDMSSLMSDSGASKRSAARRFTSSVLPTPVLPTKMKLTGLRLALSPRRLRFIALHTASNETRYRRVALSSRIAQMAIVDVLYTMIALKKPDTADGFFKIEKELVNTKY